MGLENNCPDFLRILDRGLTCIMIYLIVYVASAQAKPRYRGHYSWPFIVNPQPEGYGSHFVVRSFGRSFVLSHALQKATLTSSHQ